jgi:hypothetical protein
MAYLFFKAAEEGTANRNLRILAKLMNEEVASQQVSFESYAEAANVAKHLTISEATALSAVLRRSGLAGNVTGLALVLEGIEDELVRDFHSIFPQRDSAIFALSSLSGKGLLVPVVVATVGESYPSYCPTDLALKLGKLATDIGS